jgi:PHD/YefM family antitoxin component YafN of YafNO toxin-antitoxin module
MPKTKLRATKQGQKVSIVLNAKEYEQLLEDLEELDSIRAYDAAKNSSETPVPFERAMKEFERSRK